MDSGTEDALFLERLEVFFEKTLVDIRTFAQREGRASEEIRRRVTEWHCKALFDSRETPIHQSNIHIRERVQPFLQTVSQNLESLYHLTGYHSILLVVDPANGADDYFLGGTVEGKDFWRGLRGGGSTGVKAFKKRCRATVPQSNGPTEPSLSRPRQTASEARLTPSLAIKNDLYAAMRNELRSACGISTAEMKWTKPENLGMYGVSLIGWPSDVKFKNPSQMSIKEITTIMDLLQCKQLRFHRIDSSSGPGVPVSDNRSGPSGTYQNRNTEEEACLSWAYRDDLTGNDVPSGVTLAPDLSSATSPIVPNSTVRQVLFTAPPVDQQSSEWTSFGTLETPIPASAIAINRSTDEGLQSSSHHCPHTTTGPSFSHNGIQIRKRSREQSESPEPMPERMARPKIRKR